MIHSAALLICDNCSEVRHISSQFAKASDQDGWTTHKIDGKIHHFCSECPIDKVEEQRKKDALKNVPCHAVGAIVHLICPETESSLELTVRRIYIGDNGEVTYVCTWWASSVRHKEILYADEIQPVHQWGVDPAVGQETTTYED
jgi:hypothetical protein